MVLGDAFPIFRSKTEPVMNQQPSTTEHKFSADEMTLYYTRVHREQIEHDQNDVLSAVIAPGGEAWLNRFQDFAHRLGMSKAFQFFEDEWGSLDGRSVLDIGCGRGRWSKEYAKRGACIRGVDISSEAISVLAGEMPEHHFLAGDVSQLELPAEAFDVVNSVTVLQHMPDWKQRAAIRNAAYWLRTGGYLVLFENISALDAPHVFPHSTKEWIAMAETSGLTCRHCWGSNFEVLFRIASSTSRLFGPHRGEARCAVPGASPAFETLSIKQQLKSKIRSALGLASFPVEWACHKVPIATPTHSVMIFTKQT